MKLLKKKNFKCGGVLLLLIISIVSIFSFSPIHKITSNIDLLAFFDNNTYEEKPLSEVVNTMYVTMVDKNSKVVATTNPNIEVDKDYTFSNEQVPIKQPNINDTYKILYEIADTNDENGYAKMEEGVIYTLELPEYINPQEVYEKTISKECTEFTKKGKSIACGGIYKEDNKYIFKVKFRDVLNKKDVKASYQYQIKLDKTIEDVLFNIKTIDFGFPGVIQLFMEKEEPPVIETPNYTVNIENNGYTSNTLNYTKWIITLKDNRENDIHTKGILYLDFENDMGVPINQANWFKDIKIYADNQQLVSTRTGNYENSYSIGNYDGNNRIVKIDISESEQETYNHNSQDVQYSFLLKTLKLNFGKNDGSSIEGVKEWKIELIGADYHVKNNEDNHDFVLQAKFEDGNSINDNYQDYEILKKIYNQLNVEMDITDKRDLSYINIPKSIEYTAQINNSISNVLTIEDDPNILNNTGLNYYINNRGFGYTGTSLDSSIQIYINDSKIDFSFIDKSNSSTYNKLDSIPLAGNNGDFKSYLQIKNSADSSNLEGYYFYRSTTPNVDGDYYWIVISKDTYDFANSGGRLGYAENVADSNNIFEPADWKIYLYNASNQNVKIVFSEFIDSTEEYKRAEVGDTSLVNLIKVNDDLNNNKNKSASSSLLLPNIQPMKAVGEWVDSNTIKWNVEIDFSSINMSTDALYYYMFYIYTPKNQHINNDSIIKICNDANCYNPKQIGMISPSSMIEKTDMLSKMLYTYDYNQYVTSVSSSKYVYDGKMKFTFETKLDSYTNTSNKEGFENIWIDFVGTKGDNISNSGTNLDDINLYAQTAVYTPVIQKKAYAPYLPDNNIIIQRYDIESDLYCMNNCFGNIYVLDDKAGSRYKTPVPIHYHGTYTVSDKYETTNELEEIIARNTYIDEVSVETYGNNSQNVYGTLDQSGYGHYNQSQDNKYYKEYIDGQKVNKVWVESNNKNIFPNMFDGVTFKVEGIRRGNFIRIQYTTKLDIENIKRELSIDSSGKTEIYELINNATWNKTIDNNHSNNKTASAKAKVELLADLSIDKKTDFDDDLNYKNDSKKQEVIATIGYTSSKYLDLTDFIDGISNLKYNSESKKYDKEDLSTELNKLKEIRKYIDISNLKISIQNHYNGTYKDIYSNGSFISEYTGSTLEYINNSNELYKLHLVRSDGEDIPALKDVKITYDMTFNPDKDNSYRLNNVYKGGKFYISTNAEGIRTYENTSNGNAEGLSYNNKNVIVKKLTTQDGDYENKIDSTNKTLTVYASNTPASIGADYLEPPTILKQETGTLTTNGQSTWQVTYNVNSTGKSEKADFIINDTLSFKIDGDSDYNERIISILQKYVKYKDIKVYYNGKNTTNSDNPIYSYNNVLDSNQNISVNGITGTLKNGSSSYSLKLSSFDYGDVIIVTYGLDLDFESAYQEIIEKGYIDSDYKLQDTNQLLKITYTNRVSNPNYSESFVEKQGTKVSVSDFMPTIHKQNRGTSNDETSWEISFNTGTNSSNIKVVDNIEVSSEEEGLKEIINNSLILKDLEIKIGEDIIYCNNSFTNEWEDNITIINKSLGYEFIFKNTSSNKFISDNKKVIISYKTGIDNSKYNGKKSGLFSLNNKATITKDDLSSSDEVSASEINYEFPMIVNKEFLGNNDDLTETNWKITIDSGKIDRNNLIINDTSTLGMDFGKYLSISNIKVLLNGNEISNYRLLDKDDNDLVLNKDGVYEFKILLDKLEKDSTLEVIYTLKVNKDEYIIHDEVLDNELLINNNVNVTSSDGSDINDDDRGSSKVLSKLTKQFDFLGYDDEGNPKIRWYIDINLKDNYNLEDLVNKEIIITDELSDILELIEGSIQLNERTITSNGISIGNNIDSNNYELNTDNNIVQVKILDPINTNNIRISFDTNCLASISELENYVTLRVGEEKEEIKSSKDIRIFSNFASGIISSREVLEYRINAKKYLDGKLSNKSFAFSLVETDENGEEIENGFKTTNTNSDDGAIIFNSIVFDTEGFHYYKIKEIKENDENIIYDNTEYILRIKIIENRGIIIVDDIKILDSDSNEIVFNNRTTPKEEKPTINDILVNPNTGKSLVFILCLLGTIIIGTYILKKKRVA